MVSKNKDKRDALEHDGAITWMETIPPPVTYERPRKVKRKVRNKAKHPLLRNAYLQGVRHALVGIPSCEHAFVDLELASRYAFGWSVGFHRRETNERAQEDARSVA